MVAGALAVLAGCSGRGEIIPTPAPGPTQPSTTEGINLAQPAADPAPQLEPTTTTEPEPATTVTPRRAPATTATSRYLQPEATRSGSGTLASIRACESGGDYSTNTGNGYYGAYQFALSTWQSVGGTGYPHLASPAEQDMRAQMMIDQGRRGEWPNC